MLSVKNYLAFDYITLIRNDTKTLTYMVKNTCFQNLIKFFDKYLFVLDVHIVFFYVIVEIGMNTSTRKFIYRLIDFKFCMNY